MVEFLLHSGSGHPELAWIVVASLITLFLGVLFGLYADRIRARLFGDSVETTQRE